MRSTDLIFTHGTTDRLNIPIMSKHTMEGRYVEIFNKVKHITVNELISMNHICLCNNSLDNFNNFKPEKRTMQSCLKSLEYSNNFKRIIEGTDYPKHRCC